MEKAKVIEYAEHVFGDPDKANAWLSKPKRMLDGKSPFELMSEPSGCAAVYQLLVRVQHGQP